ncbi:las17-binding protein actin regulator domain-containing protein [Hirsutella rhossiliensis]|uniref:Las17-binding protein actin regulator domain-containing protein n=1 Tax=Hirsutella rhossiliensis TaxID=111463 RepID=A0A9P8N2Z2_9HYPO|nr:las17-binding protein actin regulator domain-containing protein [Hirsutella rhossiliensis]KAH0965662.1 las17-binding protein actin regulator domain-containing protein [Hirsutella rhossiliensis]
MQRVSAFLPSWDKRNSGASNKPTGFFGWTHRNNHAPKLPSRINIAAANGHRVHREAYWPASLDVECDKAARILKSFCTDGYLVPDDAPATSSTSSAADSPGSPAQAPRKIPKRIIQNAAGIAVFSCMRSGLWMTGSGGSGILIARKSDGTWSPPSGIMLHTPTLSFIIGVDVYDCVLVINNLAALESITRPRVTLGEDVGLTNGPSVLLDSDELHINWRELGNTVLAYMKARGQHQAVNLHGCILAERANENERFYESNSTQMDILAGNVGRHVDEAKPLFEVIKMAEGRTDFDSAVIGNIAFQSAPGDAVIATPKSTCGSPRPSFGIPKADDPDPFGVLALEMAGLEIREAGTRLRPTSSQLEHSSVPLSPSMSKFSRQSIETYATRSNRASIMSSRTVKSQATDACTRTDAVNTPETTPSPGQSDDGQGRASIDRMPEVKEDEEVDYTQVDLPPLRSLSQEHSIGAVLAAGSPTVYTKNGEEEETNDADDEDDLDDEDAEEPVVIEARGNVVTIQKRLPPPLPKRSPARNSRSDKAEIEAKVSSVAIPLRRSLGGADGNVENGDDQVTSVDLKTEEIEEGSVAEHEIGTDKTGTDTVDQAVSQEPEADMTPSKTRVSINSTMDAAVAGQDQAEKASGEEDGELADAEQERGSLETQLTIKVPGSAERQDGKTEMTQAREDGCKFDEANSPEAALDKFATDETDEDAVRDGSGHEQTDNSDSTTHEKHTSSIYTGATEDRWSCDGSSVTTPTSERRFSLLVGETEGDRPTKSMKEEEAEAHAAAQKLMSGPEKTVLEAVPTAHALSTTT